MTKRAATEIFNNEHLWSSLPDRCAPRVVAQAKYGENVLDLLSEANPNNAVIGSQTPPTAPPPSEPPPRRHHIVPSRRVEPEAEAPPRSVEPEPEAEPEAPPRDVEPEAEPEAPPRDVEPESAWSGGVLRKATDDEVQAFLSDPQITPDFLYRSDEVTGPLVDAWEFIFRRRELLDEPSIARRPGDMDENGELAGSGSNRASTIAMQRLLTPGREQEAPRVPPETQPEPPSVIEDEDVPAWSLGVRSFATDGEVQEFLADPRITPDFLYRSEKSTDALVDAWEFIFRRSLGSPDSLLDEPKLKRRAGDVNEEGRPSGAGSADAASEAMRRLLDSLPEPDAEPPAPPPATRLDPEPEPPAAKPEPEPEPPAAKPEPEPEPPAAEPEPPAAEPEPPAAEPEPPAADVPEDVPTYKYVQSLKELDYQLIEGKDVRLLLINDTGRT